MMPLTTSAATYREHRRKREYRGLVAWVLSEGLELARYRMVEAEGQRILAEQMAHLSGLELHEVKGEVHAAANRTVNLLVGSRRTS